MSYETRAYGCERAALLGPSRGRAPGEYMRSQVRKSIIRECELIIDLAGQLESMRSRGQTNSFEYRRAQLDLAWAKLRCDNAESIERRTFGPRETR